MNTRERNGMNRKTGRGQAGGFGMAPIARAVALTLAAGGVIGSAQAQQAFSPAWFAQKGAAQSGAAATGRLPDGRPANLLTAPPPPVARERLQTSIENLKTAAQAIALQQALQREARTAAQVHASNVPDGLGEGGLKIDGNELTRGWINANDPTQTVADGKTTVTIEQTGEKAILNWETFNVGRNTTVNFDQSAGTNTENGRNEWIALNRVNDPNARPSEIRGQIKADGSVYIINRNGILFTGTSQVNTRGLIASTLALSDEQFQRGINNPIAYQDTWGDIDGMAPAFGDHAPYNNRRNEEDDWTPTEPVPAGVTVEAGAELAVGQGGKLMLFGTQVDNAGALSAQDGQIILAAGEQVWLSESVNGVRGLDVAVSGPMPHLFDYSAMQGILGWNSYDYGFITRMREQVLPALDLRAEQIGYRVSNDGLISSDRGDVTLQSREVNQNGVITATTALNNLNGSIRLQGWGQGAVFNSPNYFNGNQTAYWSAGTVTLGEGSVALILPDANDKAEIEVTALATRYTPGRIAIDGKLIDLKSGSLVLAPAGVIDIVASAIPIDAGTQNNPSAGPSDGPAQNASLDDGSRIHVDSGAVVSVAGMQDVEVAMERNFIEVDLRINELRDSPLLRDSWLRGQKVVVDRRDSGVFENGPMSGVQWGGEDGAWQGTPLADVSAWIGVGVTDLKELSTLGGSILLKSGGDLITRQGSLLDISGGSVSYTGGWDTTTKLIGADGQLYSMGRALPDIAYSGIAGRFIDTHSRWGVSETYVSPILAGRHYENGYTEGRNAGSLQMYVNQGVVLEGDIAGGVVTGARQSSGSNLARAGSWTFGGAANEDRTWLLGEVVISDAPVRLDEAFDAYTALDETFTRGDSADKTTWLDAGMLARSELGEINLYIRGDFTLEAGTDLVLAPRSDFSVTANVGSTNDAVFTVAGRLIAAGGSVSLANGDGADNLLHLAEGAVIDVSGQWRNDLPGAEASPHAPALDGGSISLTGIRFQVDDGVALSVNGGGHAWLEDGGQRLAVGDAGSIRLNGIDAASLDNLTLSGWAAGDGGSLWLMPTGPVVIGGVAGAGVLSLPAHLYGDRGFRAVTINARGDIEIADGAQVELVPSAWDMTTVDWRTLASGTDLADALTPQRLRAEQRLDRAPVELVLDAQQGGNLRLGEGAVVRVDTGGSVALLASRAESGEALGEGRVTLLGDVEALAGSIRVVADGSLLLAAGANLMAAGTPVIYRDTATGLMTGRVLDGGSVALQAVDELNLEAGARIDVSGASGTLQYLAGEGGIPVVRDRVVHSDGGDVSLKAAAGHLASEIDLGRGGAGASDGNFELGIQAASGGGDLMREIERNLGGSLGDPRWYGYEPACGSCEGMEAWEIGLDFDWNLMFIDWGMDAGEPLVVTRAAIDALIARGGDAQSLVISNTAQGGLVQTAPIDLGLTETALDFFRDNVFYGDWLREVSAPTSSRSLVLRPDALINPGTISLAGADGLPISLDGVALSASRSVNFKGALAQAGTADSVIRAPHVGFNGAVNARMGAAGQSLGHLRIDARVIDVSIGASEVRGFAETHLSADELRFVRDEHQAGVSLEVDGALTITAGRVYPGTATDATLTAAGSITILGNGGPIEMPLSAGGSLTLNAPVIEQAGTLLAPFGSITLNASESLVLGAGSRTSVSGNGLLVPYGTLGNNEYWLAPYTQDPKDTGIAVLPDKGITLDAPVVDTAEGAIIDIRGGGDLYAGEFVPGTGGSHDVLKLAGAYAVLPSQDSGVAPAGTGVPVGQRIWLAGGNGLAAGWYTLLPASYAALPGAYLILPTAGAPVLGPVSGMATADDGSAVMAGRLGNALDGSQDTATGYWQVMTGEQFRHYSEYNEALASTFFASEAFKLTQYRLTGVDIVTPRLTTDAGSVVFRATEQLVLDGSLLAQAGEGGRGGEVDIAAERIAIVGAGHDASDLAAENYLIIDAASLSGFGAGSLLVGGTRSQQAEGTGVDVTGSRIVLRNDASSALSGSEIILAATDEVQIADGAVLRADGAVDGGIHDLIVAPQVAATWNNNNTPNDPSDDSLVTPAQDWGALVRVSTAGAVRVRRDGADTTRGGLVSIGDGATLSGGAALLIDATRTTELAGSAQLTGRALSVASGRIGLAGGEEGLVLDGGMLAQLANTQVLTLRSYSSIDVYDTVDFRDSGLASVVLDAARLTGHAGDLRLDAGTLTLSNSGGAVAPGTTSGGGTLALAADRLVLGAGEVSIDGFGEVALEGRERIVAVANGRLDAGLAQLALTTPVLTAENAARYGLVTGGALAVAGTGSAGAASLQDSLGASLSLQGGTVRVSGHVAAQGGAVDIVATAGDLVLAEGARIDVGGVAKDFFDVFEYADAGRIGLRTSQGDIVLAAGATLDLSAEAGGGDAGTLAIQAGGDGAVTLDGSLLAQAGKDGQGGSFTLDTSELPNFAALGAVLNVAGFDALRSFRVRNGDVLIDGDTMVSDFRLSADRGAVRVNGRIDAGARYGGNIAISAGDGMVLENGANLRAGASDGELGSGRVALDAGTGVLDLRGGSIDVSGGEGGVVRLRATRTVGHDGVAVAALDTAITGARSAVLEGVAVYRSDTVGAVRDQAVADAQAFAAHAGAIAGALGNDAVTVMAGIEIRSEGDLLVDGDWNLRDSFGADQREGGLTLRAAGDLRVEGHLSDGFSSAGRDGVLQADASWDLRLVAGADLAAADVLAVRPPDGQAAGSGSVVVGNDASGALVRTGTGDLSVAAGRELRLVHQESAVYTAGRADTTVWDDFDTTPSSGDFTQCWWCERPDGSWGMVVDVTLKPLATAAYGIQGGHLRIDAQSGVRGSLSDPKGSTVFDWLRRMGRAEDIADTTLPIPTAQTPFKHGEQGTWFVDYAQFDQGVGALGGGNVMLRSGGDIADLLVAQPTHGRVRGGRTADESRSLELRNGGAMRISAEGALRGGQYYLGRGEGGLTAATLTTGASAIAPVLAVGDAALRVTAAGDLELATVLDPLMRTILYDNSSSQPGFGYMSGYTGNTELELLSVGGDVVLGSGTRRDAVAIESAAQDLYPAITRITAFNGSIDNEQGTWSPAYDGSNSWYSVRWTGLLFQMPGERTELRLLAEDDVRLGMVAASRITPDAVPSPLSPRIVYGNSMHYLLINETLDRRRWPAGWDTDVNWLANDHDPSRIYARSGNVERNVEGYVVAGEQLWVRAGHDVRGLQLDLRNNHASHVSLVEAGNDISGLTGQAHLDSDTNVQGANKAYITLQGPGNLVLTAGRDVYGVNARSLGNYWRWDGNNRPDILTRLNHLPEEGASITVMAGMNSPAGYDAFVQKYLDPASAATLPDYLRTTLDDGTVVPLYLADVREARGDDGRMKTTQRGLVSFVEEVTGETLDPLAAWERFQALPEFTRQVFVRRVFQQELREAGRNQNMLDANDQPINGGYNRGYAAIETLFPGEAWDGDVIADSMTLRTMLGGDVNVFAPGGRLQVASLTAAPAAGEGIITLAGGHIGIFTHDGIAVNRSRVLAFVPEATSRGSDMIMWSSYGDVDAGRGAKTVRVPSAPLVETDEDGFTSVTERSDMSGSGIGTVGDGDVDLAAPQGTINAGDAGIRVAGNMNLAALQILNADNIQVEGEATGLPVLASINIGALTSASAAANSAVQAAQDMVKRQTQQARPSIIQVQVLGFGDRQASAPKPGHGGQPVVSAYDRDSLMQIVGLGRNIDPRHWAQLTDNERRLLQQD